LITDTLRLSKKEVAALAFPKPLIRWRNLDHNQG